MFKLKAYIECSTKGCRKTTEVQTFRHPTVFKVLKANEKARGKGWFISHSNLNQEAFCPKCREKRGEENE